MSHHARLCAIFAGALMVTSAAAGNFETARLDEVSSLMRLGRLIEAQSLLEGHHGIVQLGAVGTRYELAIRLAPLARASHDRELGRALREVLLEDGNYLTRCARERTGTMGRADQLAAAISCYSTIGDPSADNLYNRAWCYQEIGELAAAKADLETALQLAPAHNAARWLLARTSWRLGDRRAGLLLVADGLKRGGDREGTELFASMLRFAKSKGHQDRAHDLAARWASRLGEDAASPLNSLVAEVQLEKNDLPGAMDAFAKTVAVDRPWLVGGVTRATRALANRGDGGRTEALATIGRIPVENGKMPAPLLKLKGDIAMARDDAEGALRNYAAAVTGGEGEAAELAQHARELNGKIEPGAMAAMLAGQAFVYAGGSEPLDANSQYVIQDLSALVRGDEMTPTLATQARWATRNAPDLRAMDALALLKRTDISHEAALNIATAQASLMPSRQLMVRKFLTGDTRGAKEALDGMALVSWHVDRGVTGMMLRPTPGSGATEVGPVTKPKETPEALKQIGDALAALNDPKASEERRLAKLMEVAGQKLPETPRLSDPIVIDMDGNGQIDLTSTRTTAGAALFDLDGWGHAQQIQWIQQNHDGWLAEDRNHDGKITDGSELFGTAGGYSDGFEKLALRDKNGDGVISGAELAGLSIWIEHGNPGQVDEGELIPIEQAGVTSITIPRVGLRTEATVNGVRRLCVEVWPEAIQPQFAQGGDLDLEGI